MTTRRLLVAGLGNWISETSKHSIGQLTVQHLAKRAAQEPGSKGSGTLLLNKSLQAWTTQVTLQHPSLKHLDLLEVMFCKPKVLMNISGPAVVACSKSFMSPVSIASNRIITIQDDLDLAPSHLKIRQGGSARGHNGVKSLIDSLKGDKDFHRIMIGIGRPTSKSQVASYVLSPLTRSEVRSIEFDEETGQSGPLLERVWQEVTRIGWQTEPVQA
ncbi:hypothetical protein OIO90_004700 [Microbotryomycetes sp. JL221]|nr:hypothetical protein OIO90_004700 [Microbotryomycetes sp. JL221]